MSWEPAPDPSCPRDECTNAIETVIVPRARDLGGFEVRRVLPAPRRRMVGPFIFFDQMGPATLGPNQGIDVRPHPHVGLATVTYLFQGEFQHRDSIGSNQMIYPGEVNWMIAGKGITHSERTSLETRKRAQEIFGIQTWVALPDHAEETEPAFEHHGTDVLPYFHEAGRQVRLIAGSAFGETAPVKTFSNMFYVDVVLEPNAIVQLPGEHEERGAYIVSGSVSFADTSYDPEKMLVFRTGETILLAAGNSGARLMLLGGEALPPRHIWWNFVASSKEKIEAAKQAWREGDFQNGRFTLPVDDDQEFIPLPEE